MSRSEMKSFVVTMSTSILSKAKISIFTTNQRDQLLYDIEKLYANGVFDVLQYELIQYYQLIQEFMIVFLICVISR